MRLRLTKWGNRLAVRLPVEITLAAGLREGDTVEVEVAPVREIKPTPSKPFDKAAFIKRLRKLRASMPMTTATVEVMRREDRLLGFCAGAHRIWPWLATAIAHRLGKQLQ